MTDLLLDENNDLRIENGDVVFGGSDEQHRMLLLSTEKGAWKENPDVGVGLINYLMDDDIPGLKNEVRKQFIKDGMKVQHVSYEEATNNLNYDAAYNS